MNDSLMQALDKAGHPLVVELTVTVGFQSRRTRFSGQVADLFNAARIHGSAQGHLTVVSHTRYTDIELNEILCKAFRQLLDHFFVGENVEFQIDGPKLELFTIIR